MTMPGMFFGWWVAPSFVVMAFLSSGIRFAVTPFLEPMGPLRAPRTGETESIEA